MRQVVREQSLAEAQEGAEDALLEQEMDALSHPLAQPSMRQSAGLPSISHRVRQGAISSMPRWECACTVITCACMQVSAARSKRSLWHLHISRMAMLHRPALPTSPAEAEQGAASLCMRMLRGMLPSRDAGLSSALQSIQAYAAQRAQLARLTLST